MKIAIAHEAPLSIMKEVRCMTDYDYCLVHLLSEFNEYLEYFQESLLMGRKVILDNSIFELGKAFDSKKFYQMVRFLKPSEYIIPDVLNDCTKTIQSAENWFSNFATFGLESKSIGVVQGSSYGEIVHCYQSLDRLVDKIAISFDYPLYEELTPHPNKFYSWMYGRQLLLEKLIDDKVINYSKPHHLLGCALPQEFEFYKLRSERYSFIESLDTSNPVVHAILDTSYQNYGLSRKETVKLFTLIQTEKSKINREILYYNILKFKTFCK